MKKNNKGFTLAELLIVVAIIAVLVAIAIPVFTQQLEKSREATDLANVRSLYAEVAAAGLADPTNSHSGSYDLKQQVDGWVTSGDVAGVALSNIGSNGTRSATVTIVWNPAAGSSAENITIDGTTAQMNYNVN